jgi:peptidyl-prolyl cis-trans isomerase SurA
VAGLREGDVSEPARLTVPGFDGYHIVMMKRRIPPHAPSLEQDYDRLEALAMNLKRSKEYAAWLNELRTNIYWESRLQESPQ